MKKIISVLLVSLIFLASFPVYASDYPSEFWPLNEQYALALDSKDDAGIIEYGDAILALYAGLETPVALDIRASRSYEVANAFERLGDYAAAKLYFDSCIPIHEKIMENCVVDMEANKLKYEASEAVVTTAKHKSRLYTNDLEVFARTDESVIDYGAIGEPEYGVLFGTPCDSPSRYFMDNESMVLIYHVYGESELGGNWTYMEQANEAGQPIELALNVKGEGKDFRKMLKDERYVKSLAKKLDTLDVPVYLRFAAEMNVWTTLVDADDYVDVFRFVADIIHEYSDNVAMVWSPNIVSGWGIDVDDFYPGDEYVDWIGVSLYMLRYFQGIEDWSADPNSPLFFCAGNAANPVIMLEHFVETYGDRKPIMISESGASHTIRTLDDRDETEWANEHLRMLYNYVPMVYPQVKLIAHFDKIMHYEHSDYALQTNEDVNKCYASLTEGGMFIQDGFDGEVEYTHAKIDDGFAVSGKELILDAYAFSFGCDNIDVAYYIDGKSISSVSGNIPFTAKINLKKYDEGEHKLVVKASSDGVVFAEKTYTIIIEK